MQDTSTSEIGSKHESCLELSTSSCVRKLNYIFLMCRILSFEHFQVFCNITFNIKLNSWNMWYYNVFGVEHGC